MKGICQKAETLNDGSVKLSIYFNKEDIQSAFSLAYKEVSVKEFEATDVNKDTAIHLACQSIDKIKEMLIGELVDSVKPENVFSDVEDVEIRELDRLLKPKEMI